MFGQVVIGPPGCGKTTYCTGMHQFLEAIERQCVVVNLGMWCTQCLFINLDPANDTLPYPCEIDIKDLVTLEAVMEAYSLGPNGGNKRKKTTMTLKGLLYCIEFLEKNIDWLISKLDELPKGSYVLFDCPGQVELYSHHRSMKAILEKLTKEGWRVCRC